MVEPYLDIRCICLVITFYTTAILQSARMWWPMYTVLLFFATPYLLEQSDSSTSLVIIQSNKCNISSSISGDGQLFDPDDSFPGDQNASYVTPYENCVNNLTFALENVSSHTTILLESRNYSINVFILIQDVTNVTLKAEFQAATIQCTDSTGLAFVNVSQLSILNIVIDGCGFTGTDIENTVDVLKDIVNVFYSIPKVVQIAMLLGHCENIRLENVTVMNTRGFGLVGINVIGFSRLNHVLFFNNTHPGTCVPPYDWRLSPSKFIDFDSSNRLGGAAVFMYFDYHNQTLYRQRRFCLDLLDCNFTMNTECSSNYLNILRIPGRGKSSFISNMENRLGGSGALSLGLSQLQYGVDVVVNESTFDSNNGSRGGGVLISLFTGVLNTHVTFNKCHFEKSAVAFFNDVCLPRSIAYDPYPPNRNTTISLLNSNFTNSIALGINSTLIIFSNYYSAVRSLSEVVMVYIDGCIFKSNQAFVGSAMIIYERKIYGLDVGMQVLVKDTDFINNEILTADQDAIVTISQSAGTIDIRNVNLTLHGNCSFINNVGTAIRAESSVIGINGNITFLRNIGINGGALHLVLYSYLIMNRNSSIYFIENEARIEGGAIYVNQNGLNSHLIGGFVDCFVHFAYNNFVVCENCSDLDSFGVYIQFSGNRAPDTGRMVSGSSLSTCPWAFDVLNQNRNLNLSLFEILYEEYSSVFNFDEIPNNPTLVRSAAASLEIEHLDFYESEVTKVFPGEVFSVNISAIDDFRNIVSNVVAAYASSDTPNDINGTYVMPFLGFNRFAVLDEEKPTKVPVQITGEGNQNVSLVIYSTDTAGRAQEQLNIELYSCGFGFQFDAVEGICVCDSRLSQHGILCDNGKEIIVPDGIWIGPFPSKQEITINDCITGYCKPGEKIVTIPSPDNSSVDFNVQCNPEMNRAGFLCGSCRAGFSAVLGSRSCKQCSNWYILLFPVFLVVGIVAILLITHLNVTITAGFINGAIFYSNIVSIYDSTLVPGGTLTNGPMALISFPSLNLGFETCLHANMTTLEKVWWQLSFPFYLFILMGLATFLLRKNYIKVKQNTAFSIIQAFATLLILCYVSVLEACIELFVFTRISTIEGSYEVKWISDPSLAYFGVVHGTFGLLAYLIIVLYIVPLPILLLFPSVLYKMKYLSKYKPIYDAFWDPYKPHLRCCLGLRLLFRWIPFGLALTVQAPTNIFITNFLLIIILTLQTNIQPYQNKWVNYIDSVFLLNLVLLFSGSLFFWSKYDSLEQLNRNSVTTGALMYSSIFTTLGFLTMIVILIYHIIVRFPWLKKLAKYCWKRRLTLLVKSNNSQMTKETTTSSSTSKPTTQPGNTAPELRTPPAVLDDSVLREPLLESGVVELISISPRPVPH